MRLHEGQPRHISGAPLDKAQAAAILLHGRGATAQDILMLGRELDLPGVAYVAPQAANQTWYPNRFWAPLESNEPWLSSALGVVDDLFAQLKAAGIPPERTLILGFSQGACLALEYAVRNARRYGGVAGLSGALIGPPGIVRPQPGSFDGTRVFLGCGETDFHIPKESVQAAADLYERMGAKVTLRLYPNEGHAVNLDEIALVREMLVSISREPVSPSAIHLKKPS